MSTRTEHDSMGAVEVPSDRYWGAQTQRSLENFRIGDHKLPRPMIKAYGLVKWACAEANEGFDDLEGEKKRPFRKRPWRSSKANTTITSRSRSGRRAAVPSRI